MTENQSLDGLIQYIRVNVEGKDFQSIVEVFYNVLKQLYEQEPMELLKAFSETHNFKINITNSSEIAESLSVNFGTLVYRFTSENIKKMLSLLDMLNHKALSSAYVLVLMEE